MQQPTDEASFHPARDPLTAVDYALAALTLPFLAFVLMFATSGMTRMLGSARARRSWGVLLLALEAAAVVLVVAAVT